MVKKKKKKTGSEYDKFADFGSGCGGCGRWFALFFKSFHREEKQVLPPRRREDRRPRSQDRRSAHRLLSRAEGAGRAGGRARAPRSWQRPRGSRPLPAPTAAMEKISAVFLGAGPPPRVSHTFVTARWWHTNKHLGQLCVNFVTFPAGNQNHYYS